MSDPNDFQWLQTGGVLAFAGAVLWELRALRPILTETQKVLAALLERDRAREAMREVARATRLGNLADSPVEIHEELTDRIEHELPLRKGGKPRTPPSGVPGAIGGLYSQHKRGTTHGDR